MHIYYDFVIVFTPSAFLVSTKLLLFCFFKKFFLFFLYLCVKLYQFRVKRQINSKSQNVQINSK